MASSFSHLIQGGRERLPSVEGRGRRRSFVTASVPLALPLARARGGFRYSGMPLLLRGAYGAVRSSVFAGRRQGAHLKKAGFLTQARGRKGGLAGEP